MDSVESLSEQNAVLRLAIQAALDHLGAPTLAHEAYVIRLLETALTEGRLLQDGE